LIHDGRRYIGIDLLEGLESSLKALELRRGFQLTGVGRCIDGDDPRTSDRQEWRLDLFVFELIGELIELGADADRIKNSLILRWSRQADEDGKDQGNAEKAIPCKETLR
jgi:hypothetical protein